MFRNDNPREVQGGGGYPSSKVADDPTEEGYQEIFGAQWLVRYLLGKTLDGYIPRENVPRDVILAAEDNWRQKDWYVREATTANPHAPLDRNGPYLEADGVTITEPWRLEGAEEAIGIDPLDAPENQPVEWRQPVLVDSFGYPILYYAADTRYGTAKKADAQIVTFGCVNGTCHGSEEHEHGVYTFTDNGQFTGLCGDPDGGGAGGCLPDFQPWDFAGIGRNGADHKLSEFGTFERDKIADDVNTFAYYILNKDIYESTNEQSVVPVRRDSFILITPGPDGVYGTKDDVTNF